MREPVLVAWDEKFAHALEKALTGRQLDELLEMLDSGRALHPLLGPALADVIRSQRDAAPGAGRKLTTHEDAMIRAMYALGHHLHSADHPAQTIAWLAETFHTSTDTIKRSLKRT